MAKKKNRESVDQMEKLQVGLRSRLRRFEDAKTLEQFAALKATRFNIGLIDPADFEKAFAFLMAHIENEEDASELFFPGTEFQSKNKHKQEE